MLSVLSRLHCLPEIPCSMAFLPISPWGTFHFLDWVGWPVALTDPQLTTWFPLSSLLWFQELLARGSGGALGCGEPRANSRTAEQRELPTVRWYVPVRPAPRLGSLPERLAGEGAGRWPLLVGADEKRVVEAREAWHSPRGAWVEGASSDPYFLFTGLFIVGLFLSSCLWNISSVPGN